MASLMIKNAHLLSMDAGFGEMSHADILIDNGRIVQVGTGLTDAAAETIDASQHIVIPGFVDTHRHMWQTQLRGTMRDATLLDYAATIRGVFSTCYDPEDVYIGVLAGYLDAINAGVTTVIDHSHIMNSAEHTDAAIRAFRDSGAGGVFCYGLFPNPERGKPDTIDRLYNPPARLWDEARRVRASHFSMANDEHIRWGMALTELEFFPLRHSMREIDFCRELGAHKISAHVGLGAASRHARWVDRLFRAGELASDMLLVHGWSLTTRELRQMVETGATLSVTPETELQMAMGFPAFQRFAELGGRAGLGVDIASNNSSDMFTQMRLALQSARALTNEKLANKGLFPAQLRETSEQILRSATIDGAHALGLEDEVGSISIGKRANLVLIRRDAINMAPTNDAIAAVVHYANTGNIDTVVGNGHVLKRAGQLLNHNIPEVVNELLDSTARVIGRAEGADLHERRQQVAQIFPTDRRSRLEQQVAARLFRAGWATPAHDALLALATRRSQPRSSRKGHQ